MNTERNRNTESGVEAANVHHTEIASRIEGPKAQAAAPNARRGFHWSLLPDVWMAGFALVAVPFIAVSLRMDLINEPKPVSNTPIPPSICAISVFVIANILLVAFAIFAACFVRRMQSATPPKGIQS